jgi:hypothetical protein
MYSQNNDDDDDDDNDDDNNNNNNNNGWVNINQLLPNRGNILSEHHKF